MTFLWALFGLLLSYPECCIRARCGESNISYDGFVPCKTCKHLSKEELLEIIGRKEFVEPAEFTEFINRLYPNVDVYATGYKVYKKHNNVEHFEKCYKRAGEMTQ